MPEPNQHRIYFTITGAFDPADITRRTGITPSEAWRKGEAGERGVERRFSRWSLESRLERSLPIEQHIEDVLAQLDQNPAAFRAVSQEFGGCMQLACYFHQGYPGLSFAPALVARLAHYSLSVDFDFYHRWLEPREDP